MNIVRTISRRWSGRKLRKLVKLVQHSFLAQSSGRIRLIIAYFNFLSNETECFHLPTVRNKQHSACRECMYITGLKQSPVRGSIYPSELQLVPTPEPFSTYSTNISAAIDRYSTLVTEHNLPFHSQTTDFHSNLRP